MPCDNPHGEIDHVFKDLLPSNGMTERPEQIALAHQLLDAMLDKEIALCDAGTGIGNSNFAEAKIQHEQAKMRHKTGILRK